MKKLLKSLLLFLLTTYIISAILIYFLQDKLLYFPTKKAKNNYKESVFINNGESIHATVVNPKNKKAIIYFGGNAEDVDANYPHFSYTFKKHTTYLVQYRGYGNSTGEPNEKNLLSDALHIYDTIKTKYKSISVIGRSLGTGIATDLASKREVEKLVLVSPYDSIKSVAKDILFIYPISLILKDKYDSLSKVDTIKAPTLILYAQNDKTIKKEHTDNLVKTFPPSQVTVKTINHETHNSILQNSDYYFYLKKFLY